MGDIVEIFITVDEWRDVANRVWPSIENSEYGVNGHMLLECSGRNRIWVGTDTYQMSVLRTDGPPPRQNGSGLDSFEVLINPRLFRNRRPQDAHLRVRDHNDARELVLDAGDVESKVWAHPGPFVDWREVADGIAGGRVVVTIDADHLRDVCAPLMAVPAGHSDIDFVNAQMTVEDGHLWFEVEWDGVPSTLTRSPVIRHDGDARLRINPYLFWSLIEHLDGPTVELFMPVDPTAPLAVRDDAFTGLLMPVDASAGARGRLEALLREFLDTDSIQRDDDGDYPISVTDTDVELYVRLVSPDQPTVQVFSVLASGVVGSPGLYEELNEINASTPHVKVLHASGAVMAEIELLIETLDLPQIKNTLESVRDAAIRYRPLLGAFFGDPHVGPDPGD